MWNNNANFSFTSLEPLFILSLRQSEKRMEVLKEMYLCIMYYDCVYLHESCRNTSEWIIIKYILSLLKRVYKTMFPSVHHT